MVTVKDENATSSWRSAEKNRRMRTKPVNMQTYNRTGQDHVELVPSSVHAILLTRLTLTGLARLNGLRSLVGLTMRLATNSA